jgi:hypothetical protein
MQSKAKAKAQAKPKRKPSQAKPSQAIMLISAYPSQKAQAKIQERTYNFRTFRGTH